MRKPTWPEDIIGPLELARLRYQSLSLPPVLHSVLYDQYRISSSGFTRRDKGSNESFTQIYLPSRNCSAACAYYLSRVSGRLHHRVNPLIQICLILLDMTYNRAYSPFRSRPFAPAKHVLCHRDLDPFESSPCEQTNYSASASVYCKGSHASYVV